MPVKSSEITPEKVYNRRRVLIAAGLGVLAVPLLDKGYGVLQQKQVEEHQPLSQVSSQPNVQSLPLEPTPYDTITGYNNYYEFGYSKDDPVKAAKTLITSPWSVEVSGEGADKPGIYDIAEING
jgi:sulfoxide reductase catalytic subunit YedY